MVQVRTENTKGYHQLLVWQKAHTFVLLIYKITETFPKAELFGLTSQLQRAAISVVLNIVEGDRKKSRKEFLHFLDIADGSLTEVEACLEIARDLNYINEEQFTNLEANRGEIAAMLTGLIKSVKKAL